ncbi:peptide ABC transporter substrate-binding protein [candidate division KSB3 bacterium]|uniref:Peptide ABC transporter substrate-binding protein n=1 Tax=candidate division KSB3 bacterium TaxID=2044937 RepID=A0A2G6E243_9BACT|nr:MAG: peptide ABC transporter substrate-binding protein [candidate division KSB3 bacterium]PIE28753.1 MAG: peptide ABC transporter substrate-binding protein [candidate division KSB3 bacterium]
MKTTKSFVCIFVVQLMLCSLFAAAAVPEGPTNSNPLSDVRVRQAIAYAIDMDTIVATLLEGKAIAADSQTPNGAWKVDGLNPYSYNPEKAQELLAAANWDPDYTLDLVYYYGDQLTVDLMTAVQAYLEAVGIKMTFRKLEGDLATQLWTPPEDPINGPSAVEWDLCYGAVAAMALQEYYARYQTGTKANSHTPGTPELNKLIDAINASADPAVQKKAFAALQKYENEYLPAIPLYYQQMFIYESDKLSRNGGGYGNPQYNYDWNIVNWTVAPDKDGKQVLYTNTAPVEFFQHPWFNPGIYMPSKVLFDRLLIADPTMTPSQGNLASDYDLSEDGLTLIFTLKDGLKWHDGSDLTAEDVKWSIEYALKISDLHGVFATTFKSLEGAKAYTDGKADAISGIVVDGNKITMKFAELDPNVLLTFSQFAPLPKALLADVDPLQFQQAAFWQHPVGSGPFKVNEVQMNDYTVLTAFEDYHGGVAKIDEIILYPSGENDGNVIPNAAAGKLDYGFTKSVGDVKALEGMAHMHLTPVDIPYTRSLFVNKFPKK